MAPSARRPPKPTYTADAGQFARECQVTPLGRAMNKVERPVGDILSMSTFESAGRGGSKGWRLADCHGAAECQQAIEALAADYFKADQGFLIKLGEPETDPTRRTRAALLEIMRMLDRIRDALAARKASKTNGGGNRDGNTVYMEKEEDRQYSKADFGMQELNLCKEVMEEMYDYEVSPHELGELKALKKVAHWVMNEQCMPDPDRLKIEMFRKDKADSNSTLMRRYLMSCCLVAAGQGLPTPTTRDESAGDHDAGKQWFHFKRAQALMKEMEEIRDFLTDDQVGLISGVMLGTMHKATLRGKESASLAAMNQLAKIPEYKAAQLGTTVAKTKGQAPRQVQPKLNGKIKKRTPGRQPGKPKGQNPATSAEYKGKWADEEGAEGPNGLPRKVGGNPAGAPCTRFAQGKCGFKTCSYSHKKGD